MWFLRTDQPTIVPQLFQAAEAWRHEANKPAPGLVGRKPLREILFLTILRHLAQNVRSYKADSDRQQTCKTQGWVTQDGQWPFQKWCPDSRTLKVDASRTPLGTDAILQILSEMMEAVVVIPGVAQIPRHSQDHLRDDGHRHYGHGRGNEAYSRGADLPSFGDSTGLCRLAVARGSIQERIPEEIPSGGQNPASGPWQRVMTATYVNRSSHCYANSWVRALLAASWHCYQDFRVAGLFLPCLLQAHHAPAHARAHVQILDSEFLRLLQNWPRPHVQNDVFEFAYTFTESAGVTQAFGKWEHRVLHEGQLRLRDSGRIVSFYIQGHATQSQLWMQWQAQGGHAFLEPPPIILAQVMRFQPDASGRLRRRTGMITNWRSEVSVPVFCSSADTNVRYCTYKPVAVIMHSGHVPTSGHYTCAVICSEHILFFDDNLSPRSIPDFNAEHMRLIYGILYTAVF